MAAFLGFDGINFPVLEFSVGDLLDGFQGFLFGALGRLETALVFVVEGNGRYDGASLFAESTGVGSGAGQFTVQKDSGTIPFFTFRSLE